MPKYQLTLTEKQARIVRDACELYERLHAGQWHAMKHIIPIKKEFNWAILEERFRIFIQPYCDTTKIKFERNAGDSKQVLRHRLAWDRNPEGGDDYKFRKPYIEGTEPPAQIKRIEEHHLIHQKK